MKIVDHLNQTLNGGYNGLYGEVVTEDCYHLKTLDFVPEMITLRNIIKNDMYGDDYE